MNKDVTDFLTVAAAIGGNAYWIGALMSPVILPDLMSPWRFGVAFAMGLLIAAFVIVMVLMHLTALDHDQLPGEPSAQHAGASE